MITDGEDEEKVQKRFPHTYLKHGKTPNTQELSLPLQNSPSKPKAIVKDPGIPKNGLKKSSPSKVQVFAVARDGDGSGTTLGSGKFGSSYHTACAQLYTSRPLLFSSVWSWS